MIRKIILQLVITVAVFAAVWFAVSQINWMKVFKIEQATKNTEEKIGDLFWDLMKKSENEITSASISSPIDSMLTKICTANLIDREKIKLHILRKDEINAFALPNNHLVIYSGLITACENDAELCGVMGHELAHMEKNHVMNKLMKEIGLSVLISMSTGNGNAEAVKTAIKQLTSSAYDRKLETEADLTAVDYMIKANINPEAFANFMYRLSDETKNIPRQLFWISTHPESKERAEKMIERIHQSGFTVTEKADTLKFSNLKERIKNGL